MTSRPDVVAECHNCHTTAYHEAVESETLDSPAFRCTTCDLVKRGVQLTIHARIARGGDRVD